MVTNSVITHLLCSQACFLCSELQQQLLCSLTKVGVRAGVSLQECWGWVTAANLL